VCCDLSEPTANEGQKAIACTALQNLFDKWILAVMLNGLTSNYNLVKAIIQDWSDVNIECARSWIRECELEIKAVTGQASDQLLYVHAPNA
jgi:hypothetical protein